MSSDDKAGYKTTVPDEHWREEELQWVRILSSPHPAKGMVLLYIQKACTAFHEFEPAWKAGAIMAGQADFWRRRLGNRVRQVLVTMENNGLDVIEGTAQLRGILDRIESAQTAGDLAGLTEDIHAINHILLDSLEDA